MRDYRSIIMLEPGNRGGKPCIRGLRIAVQDVLGWLASGMSIEEIIADYPELTKEDVLACSGGRSRTRNRRPPSLIETEHLALRTVHRALRTAFRYLALSTVYIIVQWRFL